MFKGLNAIITGANKGIGKAISLDLAKKGCTIIAIGQTVKGKDSLDELNEKIQNNGGFCHILPLDIANINDDTFPVFKDIYQKFKSIDILINNAGFVKFGKDEKFSMEDFNLMHKINTRGPNIISKFCIPFMKHNSKSAIINISPPLTHITSDNFKNKIAYSLTKYLTSMLTIGLSEELKSNNIAVNSLWPKYAIYTDSMIKNMGPKSQNLCNKPDIMADACSAILNNSLNSGTLFTGKFCIDYEILKNSGVVDFIPYSYNPENAKNGKLIPVPYN